MSCSRQWRDPSGVVHNTETKTESRQCSGACDDGLCGAAAGVPTKTAPTTNLCINSTAGAVQGTGPWTWTCQGLHGSVSCSAPKDDSVHGQCQNYIVDIE